MSTFGGIDPARVTAHDLLYQSCTRSIPRVLHQRVQAKRGVVRVGGRSKSENLNSYLLSNMKAQMRRSRQIDSPIFHRLGDQHRKLADTQSKIEFKQDLIKESFYSILSVEELTGFMKQNLEFKRRKSKKNLNRTNICIDIMCA